MVANACCLLRPEPDANGPTSAGFGDASAPKNVLKVHNTGRCATRSILLARAWLMRAMVAGRTTT